MKAPGETNIQNTGSERCSNRLRRKKAVKGKERVGEHRETRQQQSTRRREGGRRGAECNQNRGGASKERSRREAKFVATGQEMSASEKKKQVAVGHRIGNEEWRNENVRRATTKP
jgi:hypothetical protein